jgi:hypothetical protein
MVIYHLGFPAHSYLIAKIYPQCKVIECEPLTDTVDSILSQVEGHRDFLFHIDLSVQQHVPPRRNQLIEALSFTGLTVHNANFTDQRKRNLQRISRELGLLSLTAPKDGNPNERLMVKSDLNVAGGPERRTAKRFPGLSIPPLPARMTDPCQYYLVKRRDIADEIWNDLALHVEKYVENSNGFVVRSFWNRGRAVVSKIQNPHQIVKKNNAKCPRWNYIEPVDELTSTVFSRIGRYAEHLRLSFFAADWVVDEQDSPFLVDLNLTPQWVVNPAAQTGNMTSHLHTVDIPKHLTFST